MRSPLKLALLLLVVMTLAPLASAAVPDYTTTTVGGFTMRFVGVEYDWTAKTSKWTYGLTWNDGYSSPNSPSHNNPQLSHLTIDLCNTASVIDWDPKSGSVFVVDFGEGASDPGDWGLVIKWDVKDGVTFEKGVEYQFSFTLGATYAVGPVTFFAKAGADHNEALIYGPTCDIATPSIDVEKSCVLEAWVGDTIAYVITVSNTGNVALSDVVVSDPLAVKSFKIDTLAVNESKSFNVSLPASSAGTIDNVVNASGEYFGNEVTDTDTCSTTVFVPGVSKTAKTYYERSWDWTLNKDVDENTLNFCGTGTADLHYTITATRDNIDSDHAVSGEIVIFNPTAALNLNIASVTDEYAGYGGTVSCPAYTVGPGAAITCTYKITLPGPIDGTNVATVTLTNGTPLPAGAAVAFGAPDVETDETATVTDAVICPDGLTCSGAGPWTFTDDGSVKFAITLTKTTAECNTYLPVLNIATLRAESGETDTDDASTEIYTCECPHGCTLTIGYWKTHAGFTGRNADDVTQFLPIWLGTAYGAKSVEVTSATQAVSILKFEYGAASNGITKLYAQLLGAKLNIGNGASDADVSNVMAKADAFLALYDYSSWTSLSKKQKSDVLTWMTLLDGYNNGDIGPGHCQ
jgi:hypothetical protein